MRLDRSLRNAQLVSDLFVEQALAQHHEHTELVRRQRTQRHRDARLFAFETVLAHVDAGRQPDLPLEHGANAFFECAYWRGFRDETAGAVLNGPLDHGGIVERRHDHRRQQFVVAANPGQRREAADAGHAQVEKQQVCLRVLLDYALQRVQAVGFDDLRVIDAIADRVDQRFAE